MPSGMTNAISAKRRHGVFKNKLPARMLVMKSTQLDRIPLHSCATSIVMFGSWKIGPSRRKGVPLRWKRTLATSAAADFRSHLERICHRVWHRHHENEVGERKSGCFHPISSEKEKTSCRKAAKERQGQQARCDHYSSGLPANVVQRVCKCQEAQTAGQRYDHERKIGTVILR